MFVEINYSIESKIYYGTLGHTISCIISFNTKVYSKNQCFRLFLSSKYGKNTYLKVSTSDESCSDLTEVENFPEHIFYRSLITLGKGKKRNYDYFMATKMTT